MQLEQTCSAIHVLFQIRVLGVAVEEDIDELAAEPSAVALRELAGVDAVLG